MKRTRTEMEGKLLDEAREIIEELVDWQEGAEEPTLTEMEDVVLELRKRLGEKMIEAIIEEQETVRPVPGPACPSCGREMHYKGMKEVSVESRTGQVRIERDTTTANLVDKVFFPLDRQLNLRAKHWSEGVLKLIVWLSGIMDYRKAEATLSQVGQIEVSDNSVWRQAQEWGGCFQLLRAT